jgi:hypothetical protein
MSGAALAVAVESVRPLNLGIADRAIFFSGLLVIGLSALLMTQLAGYRRARARIAARLMEPPSFEPSLVPTFLKWTVFAAAALLGVLVVWVIRHRQNADLASHLVGHLIATAIVVAILVEAWMGYLVGERLRDMVRRWLEGIDDSQRLESSLRRPGRTVVLFAAASAIGLVAAQLPWASVALIGQATFGLAFCGLMLWCLYVSFEDLLSRTIALIVVASTGLQIVLGSFGLDRWSIGIDVILFSGFTIVAFRAIFRIRR